MLPITKPSLQSLLDQANDLWDGFFDHSSLSSAVDSSLRYEARDTEYVISVDAPGFKKGDVAVSISDNLIRINAKRGDRVLARTLRFNKPVEVNLTRATLEDGVLTITLPKLKLSPSSGGFSVPIS